MVQSISVAFVINIDARPTVQSAELAIKSREGSQLEFDATEDTKLQSLNSEPLNEPVVGYGSFVMNTQEEVAQAIEDFNNGGLGR